jgi:hypothetical protein
MRILDHHLATELGPPALFLGARTAVGAPGRADTSGILPAMSDWPPRQLLLMRAGVTLAILLLSGCAAGRPTNLVRLREGYEVLTAHCDAGARESCVPIRVTGDPHDEEAWGFRARPAADALWREAEVFYAVGNQTRCDEVRASLGTPTEACWGPVYFRRQ